MIFKEPGNIMIHRLRVIHIYEADPGVLLAITWRQLTYELLAKDFFHLGLSATVPTRTIYDPVLVTAFQCEISKLTRSTLAKGESDATACYNRILPNLASAVSQLNAIPKTVCLVHAKTLKEATYYLKVLLKISAEHYKYS